MTQTETKTHNNRNAEGKTAAGTNLTRSNRDNENGSDGNKKI
jgi:hypothetical protein